MKLTKFQSVLLVVGVAVAALLLSRVPKVTDGVKIQDGANA